VTLSVIVQLCWIVPLVFIYLWLSPQLEASIRLVIQSFAIVVLVILLLIFVLRFVGAFLWYKHARYAWNDEYLLIRKGAWGIQEIYIPHRKIQWGEYKQTPFQRWSKVSTIIVVTAAGIQGTKTQLRDLDREQAIAYLDWLRPSLDEQPVDYSKELLFKQLPINF
jgi:uncharacterized membrane protein YdbT with pleckstrin-like domain